MIKINPSILSKTVKAITPKTEKVEEAQIRGTIVYRNQEHFVQLDGAPSNALTPIANFAEGASDAGFVHGDRVLVLIKNHQAIVTKNLTTGLQAQAAKEASTFTTAITDEGITAQRIIANDTFTNTLRANHITADEIIAGMATIDTLDANYAHITNGVIDNAKIGYADVNDLNANYAHITQGVIDNAKIGYADVNDLNANYAHITQGVIDNAKIGVADVNDLSANYAHITQGVIDNAKIGYADVDDLNAHYAAIDMANVNNAWIENGAIKKAEVFDENVFDLSGNRATLSRLDASKINVANLRADNLIVRRINGQPVVGGYTLIDSNSPGYSSKNPQALGWYEFVNADWVLSTDTTVDTTKAYYQEGNEVSLYDQTYIDSLENDLQQQIDGAVETFTGSVVPTLTNWPYTDWYDTSVTPVHDERAKHVGDIYYVVNSSSPQGGYCYRFAFDNTTHAYSWVLIKDSDVTKALSDISELQSFESETTSWIEETDEGLETIRTNYTALSGRVDDVEDTFETFESTTFTDLVDEVDEQSTTMTNMTTRLGLNADGTQSATDIVSKETALEQTVDGISTRVGKTEAHLIGMYATSSTAAGTAAKVATITPAIPSGTNWELGTGTTITVKFTNANTTASPTLNVNSKGAKPIKTYANGNLTEAEYKWKAGSTFTFTYNGTNWLMQDSTASVRMSSAETSITQNTEQIALRAKSSDVYTKGQVYTRTETDSAITTKAGEISLSVAQNEISKIEVGGRNILKNSAESVLHLWDTAGANGGTMTIEENKTVSEWGTDKAIRAYGKAGSTNNLFGIIDKVYAASQLSILNQPYVFSVYIKNQGTNSITVHFNNLASGVVVAAGEIARVVSLNAKGTGANNVQFTIAASAASATYDFIYWHPQIEYGTKVTDWTPAPEDLEGYADGAVSTAKAEIKLTTDGISTEVSKVSSIKHYSSSNTTGWTLAQIKTWSEEGHSDTWTLATDNTNIRIGDTIYLKAKDTTRVCNVYIKITVTAKPANNKITGISHGYEDVLPIETIKSTINQSSDSVKIKANHVEIDGTAVFNAISGDVNDAIGDAVDDIEIGGRNLLIGYDYLSASQKQTSGQISYTYGPNIGEYKLTVNAADSGTFKQIYTLEGVTDPISLRGKKVVFSASKISSSRSSAEPIVYLYCTSSDNSVLNAAYLDKTQLSAIVTLPNNVSKIGYIIRCDQQRAEAKNEVATFTGLKLELGNKATDWTPAPEDTNSSIAKAQSTANGANSQEQLIYHSAVSGTTSMSGTTTWVTSTSDSQNAWTTKRPTYNSSYPVLFVATQRKTVGGTVTCTTPLKDDTTTIIDGGHITTGTIDTNRLNADTIKSNIVKTTELSADKITSGTLATTRLDAATIKSQIVQTTDLAASQIKSGTIAIGNLPADVKNSNIAIGGRNLLRTLVNNKDFKVTMVANPDYTFDYINGDYTLTCKTAGGGTTWSQIYVDEFLRIPVAYRNKSVIFHADGIYPSNTAADERVYLMIYNSSNVQVGLYSLNATETSKVFTMPSDAYSYKLLIRMDQNKNENVGDTLVVRGLKLELGNKATAWSLAPEDEYSGGKNLWTGATFPFTANGYTMSREADGWIRVSGTATNTADAISNPTGNWAATKYKGGAYTLTIEDESGILRQDKIAVQLYYYSQNGVARTRMFYESGTYTFSVEPNGYILRVCLFLFSSAKGIALNGRIRWKLEQGTRPSDWSYANGDLITEVDGNGITIHPSNSINNRILLNASGLEVFSGGNSVALYGASARIGKTTDTNVAITAASTDSGIKMNVKNSAGTSYVRIADIGFDNSQGYETDHNFPKGTWYTFGYRGGTVAQRGYYSLVAGFNCIASHNASASFGINNKVYAPCGFAVGMENVVGDSSKTSQNSYTTTYIGDCSAAIGYGLVTGSGRNQLVCGWYNQAMANASPLIVGAGTASARKTVFVVTGNGDAVLSGYLTQGSDRKLKEHISYLGDDACEFISKLKPAYYKKDGGRHLGFYAQDVKEVDKWNCMTGELNGFMTLGYIDLIAPLVAYTQKLEKRIEELERSK